MKILIVDDDELVRQTLEQTLRRHGHDVATAANGRLALEHLRNEPCQLVISDWEMPEMSGPELVRAVRSNAAGAGYVYLILLKSPDGTNHVIEGLTAGADDFVTKPFNPT